MKHAKSIIRCCLAGIAALFLVVAVLTLGLRVVLPNLNQYKPQIESAIESRTGIDIEFGQLEANWREFSFSLVIHDLSVDLKMDTPARVYAKKIEVSLDLLKSISTQDWQVSDLTLHQAFLDASQFDVLSKNSNSSTDTAQILRQVQSVFLEQLDHFSVVDSTVKFESLNGAVRDLEVAQLLWQNQAQSHKVQGVISLADANLNQISVRGLFKDGNKKDAFGGKTLSGQLYLAASDIQLTPWITENIKQKTGLESANVSFESWLELKENQLQRTDISLKPSSMNWQNSEHPKRSERAIENEFKSLEINKGLIQIQRVFESKNQQNITTDEQGILNHQWKITGKNFELKTQDKKWPSLSWALQGNPNHWKLNINQLQLEQVLPLTEVIPQAQDYLPLVHGLNPKGQVTDLRLAFEHSEDQVHKTVQKQEKNSQENLFEYSLNLNDISVSQYKNAPGVNHLNAQMTGTQQAAQVSVELNDSVMPFGDIFLEPIQVKHAQIDLELSKTKQGMTLAIPKIDLNTPDIDLLGEINLEFEDGKSPFLSMYSEVDLMDIGEVWRYLPANVISPYMMNYLATSIQEGHAQTAKVLWHGDLSQYPYKDNQGVFQATIPLEETRYAFLTNWPAIEDAQLDLYFLNDALYFSSEHAKTMNIMATDLTAVIPHLSGKGHIELQAQLEGEGSDVRHYMASSPLVNTVGAALNTVQVEGLVKAGLNLNIPFNDGESLVSGYAELSGNSIHVTKPDLKFEHAKGRVEFKNDVVTAKKLDAIWLKQPVDIHFQGHSTPKGYQLNLSNQSLWDLTKLHQVLPDPWLAPISGNLPWDLDLDLLMSDVGAQYQINAKADLNKVSSRYPAPLDFDAGNQSQASFQVAGDDRQLQMRFGLPSLKYQANVRLDQPTLDIQSSRTVVGNGDFYRELSSNGSHQLNLSMRRFNLDDWITFLSKKSGTNSKGKSSQSLLDLPAPNQLKTNIRRLTFADTTWHQVKLNAKPYQSGWSYHIDSKEVEGSGKLTANENRQNLKLNLSRLHLNLPGFENTKDGLKPKEKTQTNTKLTEKEKQIFEKFPNIDLYVKNLWLQGYKLGALEMEVMREQDHLQWKKLELVTGTNRLDAKGWWQVRGNQSRSSFNFKMAGDNNSDVMERFGISSGLQNAKFTLDSQLRWQGTPWNIYPSSLYGSLNTQFDDGVISGVNNGAVKLLGIFSLDSIMRKMRLDFTGIFDDGVAFRSIKGSGKIAKSIFVTNDLKMKAVAGDMTIKGQADLDKRFVDAEVTFVPDLTSSIPVLTAFAVSPQTAVAVFAITKVLTPVVDVITKVEYGVKGSFDNPVVKELSRTKGEYKLPAERIKKYQK